MSTLPKILLFLFFCVVANMEAEYQKYWDITLHFHREFAHICRIKLFSHDICQHHWPPIFMALAMGARTSTDGRTPCREMSPGTAAVPSVPGFPAPTGVHSTTDCNSSQWEFRINFQKQDWLDVATELQQDTLLGFITNYYNQTQKEGFCKTLQFSNKCLIFFCVMQT